MSAWVVTVIEVWETSEGKHERSNTIAVTADTLAKVQSALCSYYDTFLPSSSYRLWSIETVCRVAETSLDWRGNEIS
ncbi:MAG TPA: hypothetical protein VIY48_08705 [Candidatus Paceibacterota bacterium]